MGNCVGGEKAPKSNSETEQKSGNAELEKPKSNRILDGIAKQESVEEDYDVNMDDVLGKGGFAIVRKAVSKKTGEACAAKYISKKDIQADELKCLRREIDIMKKIDHQNVLKLYDVYEDDDYVIMIIELIEGGELFYKIVDIGSFTEARASGIVKQILEGVKYLHEAGIAHRDLKPENILCKGSDDDMVIKIADFGLSKAFDENSHLTTACGTPDYAAPEVINMAGEYGKEVDMWAVGVITYVLLCGYAPFYSESQQELFDQISNADYTFPEEEWDSVSDQAKDFIKKLLVVDPNERMTAEQALQHEWIASNHESSDSKALTTLSRIGKYNDDRKKHMG